MIATKYFADKSWDSIPFSSWRESTIVGCYLTNDRRCAAKFVPSSLCRFCHSVKESIEHLTLHCSHEDLVFDKPECPPDLGPNFRNLGIVEVTPRQVENRLHSSNMSDIPVQLWTQDTAVKHL